MSEVRIVLPYPPSALNPNAGSHWGKLAREKKKFRGACYVETCAQVKDRKKWKRATVRMFAFVKFAHRTPDHDNFLASMKAGIDGVASAGIVENDRGFEYERTVFGVDKARPRVEVVITEISPTQPRSE